MGPHDRLPGAFRFKSRRYSTTLGAIRGERRAYRQRQAAEHARELLPDEQDTTLVVSRWEFAGVGYLTNGDTAWPSRPPPEHANNDKSPTKKETSHDRTQIFERTRTVMVVVYTVEEAAQV